MEPMEVIFEIIEDLFDPMFWKMVILPTVIFAAILGIAGLVSGLVSEGRRGQ